MTTTAAPRGSWLARERASLGLSPYAVCSALYISSKTLARVERNDLTLPAAWLPALRQLNMTGESPAAPAVTTAAAETQPPAASPAAPAPADPQPAQALQLPAEAAELAEMIITYRLKYGRRTGQAPAEVLTWIGQELSHSGAGQAVTQEAVERAMKALLQAPQTDRGT